MIGADVKKEEAVKELDLAASEFEENYLLLKEYAPTDEMKKTLENVYGLWSEFRINIVQKPSKENASLLLSQAARLLQRTELTVKSIEDYLRMSNSYYITKIGEQRIISQKIAIYYLAFYWEVPNPHIEKALLKEIEKYNEYLGILSESLLNTEEINKELGLLKKHWDFSKKTFDLNKGYLMPSLVIVQTNEILNKMDTVMSLYIDVLK
ncbi:hypothetical protein [Aureivirga sp. CE67]|uniref:hypothetical protein n=1 Tax=Aureivirga sp. CE67 TaxID=1788983 RepID=UPI0018CA40C0|nr:hypothetical protein [Aureivirga sp. CE67]